jgi:hypothetical protein
MDCDYRDRFDRTIAGVARDKGLAIASLDPALDAIGAPRN